MAATLAAGWVPSNQRQEMVFGRCDNLRRLIRAEVSLLALAVPCRLPGNKDTSH